MRNLNVLFSFMILCLLFVFSCNKEDQKAAVVVSADIVLLPSNAQGENLLETSTAGHYDCDSLWLYYDINGVPRKVYNRNMQVPKALDCSDELSPDGEKYLKIFLHQPDKKEDGEYFSTTYLQWNIQDMDTIRGRFVYSNGNRILHDVWYNSRLLDDRDRVGNFSHGYKIVK